jgi:FOG: Ankyrin repeat
MTHTVSTATTATSGAVLFQEPAGVTVSTTTSVAVADHSQRFSVAEKNPAYGGLGGKKTAAMEMIEDIGSQLHTSSSPTAFDTILQATEPRHKRAHFRFVETDSEGNTLLHLVAKKSNAALVRYFIQQQPDVLEFGNGFDNTPLMVASNMADLATVKTLVLSGALVNTTDNVDLAYAKTPVMNVARAAVRNQPTAEHTLDFLIMRGALFNAAYIPPSRERRPGAFAEFEQSQERYTERKNFLIDFIPHQIFNACNKYLVLDLCRIIAAYHVYAG